MFFRDSAPTTALRECSAGPPGGDLLKKVDENF